MFSNLQFSKLKKFVTRSAFWEASTHAYVVEFEKFFLQLKN